MQNLFSPWGGNGLCAMRRLCADFVLSRMLHGFHCMCFLACTTRKPHIRKPLSGKRAVSILTLSLWGRDSKHNCGDFPVLSSHNVSGRFYGGCQGHNLQPVDDRQQTLCTRQQHPLSVVYWCTQCFGKLMEDYERRIVTDLPLIMCTSSTTTWRIRICHRAFPHSW
jgi:hypothetical protein